MTWDLTAFFDKSGLSKVGKPAHNAATLLRPTSGYGADMYHTKTCCDFRSYG